MSVELNQIRELIQNARQALRRGDQEETRRWAEQAARLAPELEDPWLLLAAVSSPEESMKFARRALAINPASRRAHKAMEWARKRSGIQPQPDNQPAHALESSTLAVNELALATAKQSSERSRSRRRLAPVLLLIGLVCSVLAFAAWSVGRSSAMSSIVRRAQGPTATSTVESHFVKADISKPTYTPEWTNTPTRTSTPRFTKTPRFTATSEFTSTPLPTDTPLATETPGIIEVAILADTPTPLAPPTSSAPTKKAYNTGGGSGARWIDINLSQQMLYAYEGDVLVNSFLVSTGVSATPTVTGTYKIYARYLYADMHGPGYFLPDVPFTMYFYKSYGIHGTYWHNNFGTPMSHGCVNMSIPDAGWVYNWSTFGTTVVVHY